MVQKESIGLMPPSQLFDIAICVVSSSRSREVSLDNHLLLVVDVGIVKSVLEVLPESVAGLNLRVQSCPPAGTMNRCSDSVVACWN